MSRQISNFLIIDNRAVTALIFLHSCKHFYQGKDEESDRESIEQETENVPEQTEVKVCSKLRSYLVSSDKLCVC